MATIQGAVNNARRGTAKIKRATQMMRSAVKVVAVQDPVRGPRRELRADPAKVQKAMQEYSNGLGIGAHPIQMLQQWYGPKGPNDAYGARNAIREWNKANQEFMAAKGAADNANAGNFGMVGVLKKHNKQAAQGGAAAATKSSGWGQTGGSTSSSIAGALSNLFSW